MRLSEQQIVNFKQSVIALDSKAKIYLFGSRADDKAKGGDIDLAILSNTLEMEDEWKIKENYYQQFEEEKIDLLVVKPPFDNPFWLYVKSKAVLL